MSYLDIYYLIFKQCLKIFWLSLSLTSGQGTLGNFFHCFRASPIAQLVTNPPAMRKTWVGKIPWRWERLPTPVFWPREFHGLVHGVTKSWTQLSDFHFHVHCF